ncbi:GNAT family N-acetyltransferase [Alkaliphilus crotonatoxidans]
MYQIKIINLKEFSEVHYKLSDMLIKKIHKEKFLEMGYPRCDNFKELVSEIEIYKNTLENSLIAIYDERHFIGLIGLLFSPENEFAYLIGPLLGKEYHSEENVRQIIEKYLVKYAKQFKKIQVVISDNNIVSKKVIQSLGWTYKKTQKEMCFDLVNWKSQYIKLSCIETVSICDSKMKAEAMNVFYNVFNWEESSDIEEELFTEGKVAVYRDSNAECVGVVQFCMVEGTNFSRLEYVGVKSNCRSQGVGASLIRHVLNESEKRGKEKVFLSTDFDNQAANLYQKLGFYETVISQIYEGCGFNG